VVFGRTESFPGEFANVHIEVELQGDGSQSLAELFEEASKAVLTRLREEKRRRRSGDFWETEQQSLESFFEESECP
jgi:hypothetical protein